MSTTFKSPSLEGLFFELDGVISESNLATRETLLSARRRLMLRSRGDVIFRPVEAAKRIVGTIVRRSTEVIAIRYFEGSGV
jgi:hypothetical protein